MAVRDLAGEPVPVDLGRALLAAAGGCTVLAAESASVATLRALDRLLPRPLAGVVLTAGYAVTATVLVRLGLGHLRLAGGGSERLAAYVDQALRSVRA